MGFQTRQPPFSSPRHYIFVDAHTVRNVAVLPSRAYKHYGVVQRIGVVYSSSVTAGHSTPHDTRHRIIL